MPGAKDIIALLGSNIRHYRRARGWSQDTLAERSELSSQTIGTIERGSTAPSFETLARIAVALDVPAPALFAMGAAATTIGERGRLLRRINAALADFNDAELARAARMIEAFK